MTLEQALAARKIADLLVLGYSRECAVTQAAKFLETQGFGARHARQTADEMADLLA